MQIRHLFLFLWIAALISGCAHAEGGGIKGEIKDWPKQPPSTESIAIKFRGVTFFAPAKDLAKQSTTSHELVFWYDHPIFQSVGLAWIENGTFMKVDDGEDSIDRYPYAKTSQEYFEKLFFLKDVPGVPMDPAFLEHKKDVTEGAYKGFIKYTHGKFQIYRVLFTDAWRESGPVLEKAFVFTPENKDGFIQVSLLSGAPVHLNLPENKDRQLFEQILFSLSDEQKWFE